MRPKQKLAVGMLVRAGVIAALYFVLTFMVAPIAFGPIQFRVGEALTLLPLLFPEAVLGLTVGCFLANLLSPFSWYDVLFGTLATLVAAVCTYLIGRAMRGKKRWAQGLVGGVPPILINALVLPAVWLLVDGAASGLYFINFSTIFVTQTGVIYALGIPLLLGLSRILPVLLGQPLKKKNAPTPEPTPPVLENEEKAQPPPSKKTKL